MTPVKSMMNPLKSMKTPVKSMMTPVKFMFNKINFIASVDYVFITGIEKWTNYSYFFLIIYVKSDLGHFP